MRANLVVVQGNAPGAVLPIHSERFVIGRDPRCHLRPRSETVSQIHCLLTRHADRLAIRDMGSTNGTRLNGQRLDPGRSYPLHTGDQFSVGPLTFRVEIEAEPPPPDLVEDISFGIPGEPAPRPGEVPATLATVPEMSLEGIDDPFDELPAAVDAQDRGAGTIIRETPEFLAQKVRGVIVVTPRAGRIALDHDAAALRDLLLGLIAGDRAPRLLIDLGEVRYISSGAMGVLATVLGPIGAAGGRLKLCGVRPELLALFQSIGLDQWLTIEPDRASALAGDWGTGGRGGP